MDKLSMPELHLLLCANVSLARIGPLIAQYVREGYLELLVAHHTKIVTSPHGTGRYFNGRLHCANGPAFVSKYSIEWFIHGRRHRAAIDYGNRQEWYENGVWHRADGPAIVNSSGKIEWWVRGKYIKHEDPNAMPGHFNHHSFGRVNDAPYAVLR